MEIPGIIGLSLEFRVCFLVGSTDGNVVGIVDPSFEGRSCSDGVVAELEMEDKFDGSAVGAMLYFDVGKLE